MSPPVTSTQGVLSTSLLLCLCLLTAPLSAIAVALATLRTTLKGREAEENRSLIGDQRRRRTALVNGGRMQKSLFVARALAKRGFRVVLVEERGWGEACSARFSNAVSTFRTVPSGGGQSYVTALVQVALEEDICLFVPCSGAGTTVEDAQAGERMRRGLGVLAIIQDTELVQTLHEKDLFIALARRLGFDTPASTLVRSPEAAIELLRQPGQPPMLLKAANVLDDVGRSDMTTYPLCDASGKVDWDLTEKKLRTGLFIPLTEKSPYVAQEFIGGEGASEWCTHATVIEGKIRAFVCCPSNDMLMTYVDMTESPIGRRALRWTQDFIEKLDSFKPTGHFSFDFIHQPETDRLVVLECNPRVHTAICLLSDLADELGSILGAIDANADMIIPAQNVATISWIGHDAVARLAPSFLPAKLRHLVHPLWICSPSLSSPPLSQLIHQPGRVDAAWDWSDPFPFFALYHIQWPHLLLRQLLIRQRAWSRINLSTARIFEASS